MEWSWAELNWVYTDIQIPVLKCRSAPCPHLHTCQRVVPAPKCGCGRQHWKKYPIILWYHNEMIFQSSGTSESSVAGQRGCQLVWWREPKERCQNQKIPAGEPHCEVSGILCRRIPMFRLEDPLNSTKSRVSPPEQFWSFACVMNTNDAMMQTLRLLSRSTN